MADFPVPVIWSVFGKGSIAAVVNRATRQGALLANQGGAAVDLRAASRLFVVNRYRF
jgi:hypothetical protein